MSFGYEDVYTEEELKYFASRKYQRTMIKAMKGTCASTCKLKCPKYFSEEIRRSIHDEFWRLPHHKLQWKYIHKFTKRFEPKYTTIEGPSRRKYTTRYYLPLQPLKDSYETRQVCLKMFCGTLAITDQTIRTAHRKYKTNLSSSNRRTKYRVGRSSTKIWIWSNQVGNFGRRFTVLAIFIPYKLYFF